MGRARSLLFIVPFFAIAAVSFLAFSSFAQLPHYIFPRGPGEGSAYEEYSTIPETDDSYSVSLGKNFFRVVAPTSIPYIASVNRPTQNIYIPLGFAWKINLKAGGDDGLFYNYYTADAFRVLVGIKVLNVETGQYVPAEVLEKYITCLYYPFNPLPHNQITTVDVGIGVSDGLPQAWLEVEEQFQGNANINLYEPITNSEYKWTWDGFVLLGHWFYPHIGSIQYNITPTGSGYAICVGWVAIVMKPLPFVLRGEPARILIYVLPEFEWNCLTISLLFPPNLGNYTVRAGTPFILGDNYAFSSNIVVHENGYKYINSYGGADAYIWFTPTNSS